MNNNNKNLQEADVSTFGALLPVAAVGLAAGGYLAAKGIGSFRNFLANRAKKKSDAEAAAVPAPTPVPAPAPVPVDNSAKLARIAARKKARREEEASYESRKDAKVQGIISTYGEVGRAVGASKAEATAAAAARQAALDKAHTERQDTIKTSALNRDERLAKIAADAAAKAGERQTAKDTADAARADKGLEYTKNKDERAALADANRTSALAAKTQADLLKIKTGRSKAAAALLALRIRRQIAQSKLPKASPTSTPTPPAPTVTPETSSEPKAPSPMADAATTMADMLRGKATATESKPEEVPAAAASTASTGAGTGRAKRKPAEVPAAPPAEVPSAPPVEKVLAAATGTGRVRAKRTPTTLSTTPTPTPPAAAEVPAAEVPAAEVPAAEVPAAVPPLGKATKSSKLFPFTSSPTISVSNQKSGIVPTKTVLTNVIPVKKAKRKEPDGLTQEQLETARQIQREGLLAKRNMTDSTHYYVTSILKNLLG
jgi:hypothetical protein